MEIKDKLFLFTEVLKVYPIYELQNHCFILKLLKLIFFECTIVTCFFMGVVVFCSARKHLLLALLGLEFLVLIVYLSLFYMLLMFGYELYISLIFLVFTVCEGALGLSILVRLVRSNGNDYLLRISRLR